MEMDGFHSYDFPGCECLGPLDPGFLFMIIPEAILACWNNPCWPMKGS
jgi:hypothetical protein